MRRLFLKISAILFEFSERWNRLRARPFMKAGLVVLFVAGGLVLSTEVVFAQDAMDKIALFLAQVAVLILNFLANMVIEFMRLVIVVMQYNAFTTSPVVTTGWVIVRDTVNMFFVVVMIIIAFGTIFGHERFKWQQQVPRLLIFAVVINFSKTLAGLMIDIGQVVALTFVSAIRDIGAGNFLQLFGMTDIMNVQASSAEGIQGDAIFKWFAGAATAVAMIMVAFLGTIALLVVYVWRIVMLWVLIVLAPLAWFAGGARDVVSKLGDAYKKWWEYFTCAVAIGPIVSFFLWLTLAVVGGGSFTAQDPGLSQLVDDQGGSEPVTEGLAGILDLENLIPFVLGIGMIFAGFEAAMAVCGSAPGMGGKGGILSKGKGYFKAGLRGMARAPGRVAAGSARLAGRGAGAVAGEVDKRAFRGMRAKVKEGVAEKATNVAQSQAGQGNALRARIASGLSDKLQESRKKDIGDVSQPVKDLSKGGKLEQLKAASQRASDDQLGSQVAQDQVYGLMSEMFEDPSMMQQMEDEELEELWGGYGEGFQSAMQGDEGAQKAIRNFKQRNPHIAAPKTEVEQEDGSTKTQIDDPEGFVDETFKTADDFRQLDPAAFENEEMGEALSDHMESIYTDYTDQEGNALTVKDAALKGRYGKKVKEALKNRLPDAGEMVGDPEVFDMESGRFKEGARQQFDMRVRENPQEIGKISSDAINAQGGNNDIVSSIGEAMDKQSISNLMNKYRTAKPEERKQIGGALDNVELALDHYSDQSMEPEKTQKLLDRTRENRARVEAISGGIPEDVTGTLDTGDVGAAQDLKSETEQNINELSSEMDQVEQELFEKQQQIEEIMQQEAGDFDQQKELAAERNALRERQDQLQSRLSSEREALDIINEELEEAKEGVGESSEAAAGGASGEAAGAGSDQAAGSDNA